MNQNTHYPEDGNDEQFEKDLKREKDSLWAVYKEHCNQNVVALISHMAEALAYQYSVNRANRKIINDLLPDRSKQS